MPKQEENWYTSVMTPDGTVVLKINNEKYSSRTAKIKNIGLEEENSDKINFDCEFEDESFYNEPEYVELIQKAVGDIIAKAISLQEAEIKRSLDNDADVYFTKIFREKNLHMKTAMTSSQVMKVNKLYPCPIVDKNEDLLPAEGSDIQAYIDKMKSTGDYSVFDLDDNNKEYNMTVEADKDAFIALLKERGKEYVF